MSHIYLHFSYFWISSNFFSLFLSLSLSYADYDGFVVLMGTDTMAYTASGLSFMFENLAKPVILTGAQLSVAELRSDGLLNILGKISYFDF